MGYAPCEVDGWADRRRASGPVGPDAGAAPASCSPDGWHAVYIALDEAGRWQVFDASAAGLVLVETLTGHDDLVSQAQALALDYAREQAAYRAGRRDSCPLPRPQMVTATPRAA